MPTDKWEYQFIQAQAFWNEQTNEPGFDPDLSALGKEGWRIIKIVPREKDFFDIFFERPFLPDVRSGLKNIDHE